MILAGTERAYKIRYPVNFQQCISKVAVTTVAENFFYKFEPRNEKGKILQQLENFEIYKGCLSRTKENFSPVMLVKGKISKQHDNFEIYKDFLLWKKESLTSVMLKERFKNRLKISNFIKICMEKHLTVTG